uniref:VTT domain-containing protein n=1 Tax=Amphora coffeiformis TaxID=265554 RepID=A0A7S3P7C2_9STRA|mmetsp:Transcript_3293/g.6578  ORF Transcript_3293/g.6578 Transcript_3293/m.6578 type:complete len:353 (+) Transcript_3293:256-1314(+)|eukprot:scaffold2353_cov167-Amphora_coffeaeformis.AAC.32
MKSGANERRKHHKKDEEHFSESDQETSTDQGNNNGPPFLPLEATTEGPPQPMIIFLHKVQERTRKFSKSCNGKKVVSGIMFAVIGLIIWDAVFTDPANRVLKPDFADTFLRWVQSNPTQGIFAFLVVIATAVVFMIPIGTPLTLGCGYIYKAAYGWTWGLTLATIVSMAGSALGAVACFLLGRYLMREQVRLWIRKYPLFDAIDIAAAEHGLRIMAMLYLTPILPLGPVSYMCGTTSMALRSFVLAKVASLPLMLLYCFIGASTGSLLSADPNAASEEVQSIEKNQTLIISGILLSFLMIGGITHFIKKELDRILERQKKEPKDADAVASEEAALEMGMTPKTQRTRHRRAG